MNLKRVTMTGPDDSISADELIDLSQEFRFVEWGILVSERHTPDGSPRFPSLSWIKSLQAVAMAAPLQLSLHVCGRWVRELLVGNNEFSPLLDRFQRVQLNFHAEKVKCDPQKLWNALRPFWPRQIIFQIDGVLGNQYMQEVRNINAEAYGISSGSDGVVAVPLFDVSGGAGVLPESWPAPAYFTDDHSPIFHGYAGGLGPENLAEQLPFIGQAAGECPIWIDAETHIRSDGDRRFDLAKVRKFLEIAQHHVKE